MFYVTKPNYLIKWVIAGWKLTAHVKQLLRSCHFPALRCCVARNRLQGWSFHLALTWKAEDVQVALAVSHLVVVSQYRLLLVLLICVPVWLEVTRLLLDCVDCCWYNACCSFPTDHIKNLNFDIVSDISHR